MCASDPRSLHFCFSTLGCPDLDLDAVFDLAKRFGFGIVELRALEGTVDLPALFEKRYGSPEAFAEHVFESGVRIASLDTSLKLMDNDADTRLAFLDFIPWAEAIGGTALRVFDGKVRADEDAEAGWRRAAETMHWWDDEHKASEWQSTMIVETHDTVFTAATIRRLMEHAPDSVGLLWDSHHTWKRGGEDPLETWRACQQWVRHVHFKDSVSKPSARHPFTYVDLGTGEFPLDAVLNALAADAFSGPVSLEWEKMWHPYLRPLDEALEGGRQHGWW
ncbi:MAG: sugar phosphate isomerase/epimerase [Verrucomicrobia bacterium]|nr:MAG: sugar phosphate isomerase/epimerase [Verrucomicrobiota bacterium]